MKKGNSTFSEILNLFKYKDCMASCDAKVLDEETGRISNGCNNNVTEDC